jgi:L-serine dehydratase
VTRILARHEVNIAFMRVSRQNRGATAMMIMELDDEPVSEVVEECSQVCDVEMARVVPAV